MSINFEEDMNDEARAALLDTFADQLKAMDERTALVDSKQFTQQSMKKIAVAAKQVATLEMHGVGDIKILSDGTKYEVTPRGWEKLDA